VEFKHAKKYLKSECGRRERKRKEKKKTKGEKANKQRKRNHRLEEQTNTQRVVEILNALLPGKKFDGS
jgi:hypothetical protein